MSVVPRPLPGPDAETSLALLDALLAGVHPRSFAVRLWNSAVIPATAGHPARFTLFIHSPGVLRRMFEAPTEVSLGEAYLYDDCDIEGDVESAVRLGQRLIAQRYGLRERLRLRSLLRRLPQEVPVTARGGPQLTGKLRSKDRDRAAIRYHYDLSNDFYALFLDRQMIYSSGYFARPDEDLDSAQTHKLESICRALDLRKGDRLLDIGCGWGGLILYAVQQFGVEALGITLSERQAELARERIRQAGLQERCRVEIRDYRDLDPQASFDKITSIGMVEHVGAKQLREYFSRVWGLLPAGGAFVNSGISRLVSEPAHPPASFSDAYVFPDGELEPLYEILGAAEMAGFELRSCHNLREHYALTLFHWLRRLEAHAEEARAATDDKTYRLWRLFMAGSALRFSEGKLQVFQSLLVKPGLSSKVLTRAPWEARQT